MALGLVAVWLCCELPQLRFNSPSSSACRSVCLVLSSSNINNNQQQHQGCSC